jgi:propionyl-CoA synthetase
MMRFGKIRCLLAVRNSLRTHVLNSRANLSDASIEVHRSSLENPGAFWGKISEDISWFKKPEEVLNKSQSPLYRWFKGGQMNTCYNCIDRHIEDGFGDQLAIIHDSPVSQTIRKITYNELGTLVSTFAGLMVENMPNSAEAAIAMLACARIGATHSVVFGGFAPHELATRIRDCAPTLIICSSCGIDASKIIEYKPLVDEAIELAADTHRVEKCIVWQREQKRSHMIVGRDIDWAEGVRAVKEPVKDCVPVDSTHPLYILYTSGTTGQPKGKLTVFNLCTLHRYHMRLNLIPIYLFYYFKN